eukprot:gene10384-13329_t
MDHAQPRRFASEHPLLTTASVGLLEPLGHLGHLELWGFQRSAVQLSVSCPGRRPRSRAAVAAAAARWSEKDRDLRPSCTCCAVVCRRAPPPTSSTKASTSVVTILPRYPRSNLKAVGAASVYCPLLNPQ